MTYKPTPSEQKKLDNTNDPAQRNRLLQFYENRAKRDANLKAAGTQAVSTPEPAKQDAKPAADKEFDGDAVEVLPPQRNGSVIINVTAPPAPASPSQQSQAEALKTIAQQQVAAFSARTTWRHDASAVWHAALLLVVGAMLGSVFLTPVIIKQVKKLAVLAQ